MAIIASDILADLCGLSLGLLIALLPVGLLLWLMGWWCHRFWIVLATTVTAGVFGLMEAGVWRVQPIVVAVLLAIAAGVLALALVRVITFIAGGMLAVYLVHFIFPALNQQMVCFLIGGLVGLVLFRWFFMASTSFVGSVLVVYATLALLHYRDIIDAVAWSDENTLLLTIVCGVATLLGFTFQFLIERRRQRKQREREGGDDEGEGITSVILARIGFGSRSRDEAA
jgi:hypothetical protein